MSAAKVFFYQPTIRLVDLILDVTKPGVVVVVAVVASERTGRIRSLLKREMMMIWRKGAGQGKERLSLTRKESSLTFVTFNKAPQSQTSEGLRKRARGLSLSLFLFLFLSQTQSETLKNV